MLVLLAAVALAQAAPSDPPVPDQETREGRIPAGQFRYVPPRIGSEDYPYHAMIMGIEGRSMLRLEIGADGAITRCDVSQSAGLAILDERACLLYRRRGRFTVDPALAPVVAHAPVAWRLGDPTPFNMFAMLNGFERAFPGLRSGDALPAAFQGSARCSIAGGRGTCRLPAPRESWLGSNLARGPAMLSVLNGRAEVLSFRTDPDRRQWVLDALVRRLGSPCRETASAVVWCAPRNWQVSLAKDVVSIARNAGAG